MNEKQIWEKYARLQKGAPFSFGSYYSYQFRNTPRHILFTLSRYKFALNLLGKNKEILELGCNEGLGSYFLHEFAKRVHGVDFDADAITWAQENFSKDTLTFQHDNFLGKKYGNYDAIVSYDVIEHIYPRNESLFLKTLQANLKKNGVCFIGTPNLTAEKFSNPELAGAHINLFSGDRLKKLLEGAFHNVFLFSVNDETVHTGYTPMAHYLLALCTFKKGEERVA